MGNAPSDTVVTRLCATMYIVASSKKKEIMPHFPHLVLWIGPRAGGRETIHCAREVLQFLGWAAMRAWGRMFMNVWGTCTGGPLHMTIHTTGGLPAELQLISRKCAKKSHLRNLCMSNSISVVALHNAYTMQHLTPVCVVELNKAGFRFSLRPPHLTRYPCQETLNSVWKVPIGARAARWIRPQMEHSR